MEKGKKKALYYILLITAISFIIFYSYKFLNEKYEDKINQNNLEEVSSIKNRIKTNDNYALKYEQYQKEYNNSDIIGNLKIANTEINTLLVQTTDNKYYLKHLITKKYSVTGSVFVDYKTNIETGKQINIYGHNSTKYDIPFKYLVNYLNKDYFLNNKIITLETKTGIREFEIFSVKVVTDDIEHIKTSFNTDTEWNNHFDLLRAGSLYDSNLVVDQNDQVLVLQTCLFNNSLGRYLIISAKKI